MYYKLLLSFSYYYLSYLLYFHIYLLLICELIKNILFFHLFYKKSLTLLTSIIVAFYCGNDYWQRR